MPNTNNSNEIKPEKLEWVWILTSPITKHRDNMLTLEDTEENVELIPCFNSREEGQFLKPKLCQEKADEYTEQAIHIDELVKIAARRNFEIILLNKEGKILSHIATELTFNKGSQEI